jgi:hypothetical protein
LPLSPRLILRRDARDRARPRLALRGVCKYKLCFLSDPEDCHCSADNSHTFHIGCLESLWDDDDYKPHLPASGQEDRCPLQGCTGTITSTDQYVNVPESIRKFRAAQTTDFSGPEPEPYVWRDVDFTSTRPAYVEEMCTVCQYPVKEMDLQRALPCGHTFHDRCLWTWVRSNVRSEWTQEQTWRYTRMYQVGVYRLPQCPNCRQEFQPSSLWSQLGLSVYGLEFLIDMPPGGRKFVLEGDKVVFI